MCISWFCVIQSPDIGWLSHMYVEDSLKDDYTFYRCCAVELIWSLEQPMSETVRRVTLPITWYVPIVWGAYDCVIQLMTTNINVATNWGK